MNRHPLTHIGRPGILLLVIGTLFAHFAWDAHLAWADTTTYNYDAQGRLVQAKDFASGSIQKYVYDTIGNRRTAGTYGAVTCADRMVCNADFEDNFTEWSGADNAVLVTGHSGQGAQVWYDGLNSDIQQLLPGVFAGGATYRVTAWCKADTGSSCRMFLGDSNSIFGPGYEHTISQEWGGNGDWQLISTPPLTLTHDERLNVYVYGDQAGPAIYDDVQVEEVEPFVCPEHTVCNGDFERGFEYWDSVKNAVLIEGRNGGTGVQVNADGANGDIIQTLPGVFEGGGTYTATAWCKAAVGEYCRMFLGDSNVDFGPVYENVATQLLPGTGDWQQLEVTLTLSHDEHLQIYLYGWANTAVYDDVQVQEDLGMIAAYPFSEGSGTTTMDVSGNGHDGTLLNGVTWTSAGIEGHALQFDGVDDYVDLGPVLDVASHLSLEAWVKDNGNSFGSIIEKYQDTLHRWHIFLDSQGFLYWDLCSGDYTWGTSPASVLQDGQWHHLAMIYDGTQPDNASRLRAYIDGQPITLSFSNTIPSSLGPIAGNVHIGRHNYQGTHFSGLIDEVRIYNRSLSAQEVLEHAARNTAFGLVAAYPFAEGSSTTTADVSGNGHTGTLINGITWTLEGKEGNALSFDGTNDVVEVVDASLLRLGTTQTIAGWLNLTQLPSDWVRIIGKGDLNYRNYGVWLSASGTIAYQIVSNGGIWVTISSTTQFSAGSWNHFAATYDGTTIRLYINGQEEASEAYTYTPAISADPLTFGYAGYHTYLNGTLDEVRIYGRSLTATEVQTLYTSYAAAPAMMVFSASPSDLPAEADSLTLPDTDYGDVVSLDGRTLHINVGDAAELNYGIGEFTVAVRLVPSETVTDAGEGVSEAARWHTAVGLRRGGDLALYLDGVEQAGKAIGDRAVNHLTIRVGGKAASDTLRIDDVRLFDRALTPDELAELREGRTGLEP